MKRKIVYFIVVLMLVGSISQSFATILNEETLEVISGSVDSMKNVAGTMLEELFEVYDSLGASDEMAEMVHAFFNIYNETDHAKIPIADFTYYFKSGKSMLNGQPNMLMTIYRTTDSLRQGVWEKYLDGDISAKEYIDMIKELYED